MAHQSGEKKNKFKSKRSINFPIDIIYEHQQNMQAGTAAMNMSKEGESLGQALFPDK